jgi:hypothetical protein
MTFTDDLEAVRARAGMPRFTIRRHRLDYPTARPWAVADRNRPHWLGTSATHAAAIELVDAQLARELPEFPDCDCGSVDKWGDDLGEHSPRCPYHLEVLRWAEVYPPRALDAACKRALARMARHA